MDATTVLEIIQMIDNQIINYKKNIGSQDIPNLVMPVEKELTRLRDHLQNYIESQLTAHEMNTEEG